MYRVKFQEWITREDVKTNRDHLYIFGDNMERVGLGGQAAAMRGEPNSLGIATKRSPGMSPDDFFSDREDEFYEVSHDLMEISRRYEQEQYSYVVYPSNGVGTGLAKLPEKSPMIYKLIQYLEDELKKYEVPNE